MASFGLNYFIVSFIKSGKISILGLPFPEALIACQVDFWIMPAKQTISSNILTESKLECM